MLGEFNPLGFLLFNTNSLPVLYCFSHARTLEFWYPCYLNLIIIDLYSFWCRFTIITLLVADFPRKTTLSLKFSEWDSLLPTLWLPSPVTGISCTDFTRWRRELEKSLLWTRFVFVERLVILLDLREEWWGEELRNLAALQLSLWYSQHVQGVPRHLSDWCCQAVLFWDGWYPPCSWPIDPDHQDRCGGRWGPEKTSERHVHSREREVRSASPPVPCWVQEVPQHLPCYQTFYLPSLSVLMNWIGTVDCLFHASNTAKRGTNPSDVRWRVDDRAREDWLHITAASALPTIFPASWITWRLCCRT